MSFSDAPPVLQARLPERQHLTCLDKIDANIGVPRLGLTVETIVTLTK